MVRSARLADRRESGSYRPKHSNLPGGLCMVFLEFGVLIASRPAVIAGEAKPVQCQVCT